MSSDPTAIMEPPTTAVALQCFHCGEPCPDESLALAGKNFCCLGCRTVFGLLSENGLGQFYELNAQAGTRIRNKIGSARWAFLDDSAVQEKLFDFAGKNSARVTLHLPQIHCVACVWLLENLFKLHAGVGKSVVNFSRREAAITFAPEKIKFSELAALLESIGYEPQFTFGEMDKPKTVPLWRSRPWLQIGLAGFAFGNIMIMSLPFYMGLDTANGPWFRKFAGWLAILLALPVVVYSASDFWRSAWASLRQKMLTMEVPIALGLAAIYGSSILEVAMQRGPGYCDSLCGLIFFLLCGRLFQKKTHDRLTFDRDYKGFFPLSVVRKNSSGEQSVAISQLQTGDRLVLRNGELVPADAKLVAGDACIDYSFVTGESEPVKCGAGERLYAGGRQVGGAIEIETVKPVAQSYLAALWNNEAFHKPGNRDLDSLTNRYSRRFTKLVIGVALGAAVFWAFKNPAVSLKAFTSVLIVACPCALALAAPLTHGTAQRLLARRNIFLKNELVIERMAEVDTVVLDKTGTLTTADAGGVSFQKAESGKRKAEMELSADEKKIIGAVARLSTHPNSVRVAKMLNAGALPVRHFQETPGCGVEGEVDGRKILLGASAWVCTLAREESPSGEIAGSTVFVAIDGVVRGAFVLENTLRPEVESLVAQLGGKFELALLSGDNEREAARFQKIFGERAALRFNQTPADKLEFIRDLQRRGKKVMMVGDGLNDAGALKQSDVGVAVVEKIGVFSPASDVILDAAQVPKLAQLLAFSRRSARVVRAGFAVSALYNVAGVSIAAAGLLAPIVCAVLMPLSSVTVVVFASSVTAWMAHRSGFTPETISDSLETQR
jgi:P-type Cu+ transporter